MENRTIKRGEKVKMSEKELKEEELKEIITNTLGEIDPINKNENGNKEWFEEFKDKWNKIDKKLTKIENIKGEQGSFIISRNPYTLEVFKENFNIEVKDELKSECCKSTELKGFYLRDFDLHLFFCSKCNALSYVILRKWMMGIKPRPPN